MWAVQRFGIEVGQRLLRNEINHGKRMIASATVDGDKGGLPIRRSDHFMRVRPDRSARDHLQRNRIHNGKRVVALREREQRLLWSGLRNGLRYSTQQCRQRSCESE